MNKQEAKQAMQEGKKICHESYDGDCYLYIKDGVIYDEVGIDYDEVGWNIQWQDNWHLYNG